MEDIALRREIEEKKKREGKWQEPKLTPKQKEAMNVQLEKESLVRNHVRDTKAFLTPYLYILQACVKGKPKAFSSIIPSDDFLPALNKMLKCPLFNDIMSDIVMGLRSAVFENEDDTLAQIILASTINIVRDGQKTKF